jgi:hypothetical protein
MTRLAHAVVLLAAAAVVPLAAQAPSPALSLRDNPFRANYGNMPAISVTYTFTGDMVGSARTTASGNRSANWSAVTAKFFGRTSSDTNWGMATPDTIWNAEISRRTGTISLNPLPVMSRAYQGLDADSKARFQSNMQAMAQYVAQALRGIPLSGATKETKQIAGESCEMTTWGSFSYCTMTTEPITLYTAGSLYCVGFQQTATSVTHTVDTSLFRLPDKIKWTKLLDQQKADSMAQAWVKYLGSKQLADSIAKAQKELAQHQDQSSQAQSQTAPDAQQQQMSPEDREKMCEKLKNYSLSTALDDAWKSFLKESAQNAGRAAADKLFGRIIHH